MHDERVNDLKQESLPELLRQLASETTTLVHQEIELAKTELGEKAKTIGASAGYIGAASILTLGAFGALTTFIIALIALALPVWAAALIVTLVYAIAGFVAFQAGKKKLSEATPVVPQQTAQSLKEDVQWVKTRAQSSKK